MWSLLLLAAAVQQTPVEAERAFAADAKTLGQWTAFRKWSTDDATMFVLQPVKAHAWLKDREDPPKSVQWSPMASFVSCDGKAAVNTGEWRRPDGSTGYFTTVWLRQPNGGWKWSLDHGDELASPRAPTGEPSVQTADCKIKPVLAVVDITVVVEGAKQGSGRSPDETLQWFWRVSPDGSRRVRVAIWDGRGYTPVVTDRVAAPTP